MVSSHRTLIDRLLGCLHLLLHECTNENLLREVLSTTPSCTPKATLNMKILLITFVGFFLCSPVSVYAEQSFGSWVEGIVSAAQEGNGTVIIENHSSVSTGGQTAASGQSVSTGDSSASSRVETRINAGESGGRVDVKVETESDGIKNTESYSKELNAGERVDIRVATSTGARIESGVAASSSATSSLVSKISSKLSIKIPEFVRKMFSFFWWR